MESAAQHVPALLVGHANLLDAFLRPFQGNDGRDLNRSKGAIVVIAFDARQSADKVGIANHEAHTPPLHVVALGEGKKFHCHVLGAVHLHFGLPAVSSAALKRFIKRADRQAAYLEATQLAGFGREEATKIFGRPEGLPRDIQVLLEPWEVSQAQHRYRERISALTVPPP